MRGFTLVEIMISVVILGVGLTSVSHSYILALRGANSAQNNIAALILAKEKFESLELATLKGALIGASTPLKVKFLFKDYTYQEEIKEIADSESLAKELVLASLTVSWNEKNFQKNVTLASYFPKQK